MRMMKEDGGSPRQIDAYMMGAKTLDDKPTAHPSTWAETVKAKKAAAKQQMTEAHGLMAGEHALGGQELDSAAENLRVYFDGQEREHGANALKAIQKSVEEAVDETDAGAGNNPVQRMEKGRHEGAQRSNAGERDE